MAFAKAIRVIKNMCVARLMSAEPRDIGGRVAIEHLHVHVVPRWGGDDFIIIRAQGDSAAARHPSAACHRVGSATMSKLPSCPGRRSPGYHPDRQGTAAGRLTPDVVPSWAPPRRWRGALTLPRWASCSRGACVVWFFVLFDMLDGRWREREAALASAVLDHL